MYMWIFGCTYVTMMIGLSGTSNQPLPDQTIVKVLGSSTSLNKSSTSATFQPAELPILS